MKNLFFYACLTSIFISCNQSKVSIADKNFKDEVSREQNLIFTLNKEIAPDSLLDRWDTTAYIKFSPQVRGKFKWVSKTELLFSPETAFQASTRYQAELQKVILNKNTKLRVESNKIDFYTPLLSLQSAIPYWTAGSNAASELHLNLLFNYRIDPNNLKSLLKIQNEGKNIPFRFVNIRPDRNIEIAFLETGMQGKTIRIDIEKGLICDESSYKTPEVLKASCRLPDPKVLEILTAQAEYDDMQAHISVVSNQGISTDELKSKAIIAPQPEGILVYEANNRGFFIKGNFNSNETYTLRLPSTLVGVAGGILKDDFVQTIAFGKLQPQIAFTEKKAMYLSSKGYKNIGVRISNVPQIKVDIYKIYENNLQTFTKNFNYQLESENTYDYSSDEGEYNSYEEYGTLISSKEYETKQLPSKNGTHLLNISTQELKDFKGCYAVVVGSTEQLYQKAFKLIAISDVGLVAKENGDHITVFANSIMHTKSIRDVKINVLSANNQVLGSTSTDENGVAQISGIKKKYPKFKLKMITASYKEDFTFLDFEKNRTENSRFELGGLRSNEAMYQAFVHQERDLYRPGEEIHFSVLVRDENWQTQPNTPIKTQFTLPNGKEFVTLKGILNEQGAWEGLLRLPESSLTGSYKMEVFTLNDVLLNTSYISVEEFMPDRIKIVQQTDKSEYSENENIKISGWVQNMYGTPAAGRNYQLTYQLRKKQFSAKGYEKYNFGLVGNQELDISSQIVENITSTEGKFEETISIANTLKNRGLLQANFYTVVFDETGRPVYKSMQAEISTQKAMLGMENMPSYIDVGQAISLNMVALDKKGANTDTRAVVQLVQFEWQNVAERDYEGNIRYISNRKEKVIEERTIRISGKSAFAFRVARSGEYQVRIRNADAESYVAQDFYAYGYGTTDYSSFEINKDGQVDITADKDKYEVGEIAKILFKAPFDGKLLVSIERNNVLEHFYLQTDKKAASFNLSITDKHLPNIYIAATLIKSATNGAIPLTVAHGYLPLGVEAKKHKMPVSIQVASSSYSNTEQNIKIKTEQANTEVLIAVVDEGILQIKDFQNPNPYDFFFQKRALEINAYDLYPRLFPEMSMNQSSFGGGDAGDAGDAANKPNSSSNPMSNKRVKLVSFWSGILKTNLAGEVNYKINIPQFSGSLRVMAVAYKGSAFGAASGSIKVADPVVISSAIPRFLSPNDELLIPVSFANTTKQTMEGMAKIKVGNGLIAEGSVSESIRIEPESEKRVFFKIKANDFIGTSFVEVVFGTQNKEFGEKIDISIRSASPLQKKTGFGVIQAGSLQNISLLSPFIASTSQAKLVLSNSPMAQFSNNLDYLLQYPYGCVEQTISTAFPQLYAMELSKQLKAKNADFKGTTDVNLSAYHIQQAISKIQTMQVYNGGLSYWQGSEEDHWWGSVYAAHFLWEAKKAGYSISEPFLERIMQYLEKKVKDKKIEKYYFYNAQNQRFSKQIIGKEVAYTLYVLALMRRGDASTMNYCKANTTMLAVDSKYLLAASYTLMGDAASAQSLLPKDFKNANEFSENALSGSFYSYIRDEALSLNALIESDSRNAQIPLMVKHLSEQIRNKRNLNTQESAFALVAMGKLAKQANQSDLKASIKDQGKEIALFDKKDLLISKNILNKTLTINALGKGSLYYFWELQGVAQSANIKEEDSYLKVRRSFYNRAGQQISDANFKTNDLVVVKVSIQTTDKSSVPNVAISDLLPAGFEVENPRLVVAASMPWIKDASTPDYTDIRDDRVYIFCEAEGSVKHFYYMVRAVSQGNFQMGAISAEAMYASEYHSYFGARKIQISEKNAVPLPSANNKKPSLDIKWANN